MIVVVIERSLFVVSTSYYVFRFAHIARILLIDGNILTGGKELKC